jgi:hypothetical protein
MISSINRTTSLLVSLAAALIALSCAGGPKPAPPAPAQPDGVAQAAAQPVQAPEPAVPSEPATFDPAAVTEAVKSATFVDVRSFIESLNRIIRLQDFDAWRSHLTEDYIEYYSSAAVLDKYSEYPIIKRNGIKLRTLKDYFVNVVYPSRQNDKVDDIEFVGENLIKAITVSPKGDRNILYMLEKHGDAWNIGIGR